jgi:hypothetical protein
MTVEAATLINTLDATYPASGDDRNEGDNHLRLIKSAVKATFPNITGAVSSTHTELNLLTGVTGVPRTSTSTPIAGELVLMATTTISGGPSAVDFVHGSGGVTISSAYSEYILVFEYIHHGSSSNALLRVLLSQDAGSTWVIPVSTISSAVVGGSASPATTDHSSLAYYPVMGELANSSLLPGSGGFGVGGQVHLIRDVSADRMWLRSWMVGQNATNRRAIDAYGVTTSPVNGIRLAWNSGAFANTGTVKLLGRKA